MEQQMSFGDFVWPCNPGRLVVRYGRNILALPTPYAGGCLQDFGREKRVAEGEGIFPGENALDQAVALAKLCQQGETRLLALPGHMPFYAVLRTLEITGSPAPEGVCCRFLFWEDMRQSEGAFGAERLVTPQ